MKKQAPGLRTTEPCLFPDNKEGRQQALHLLPPFLKKTVVRGRNYALVGVALALASMVSCLMSMLLFFLAFLRSSSQLFLRLS